MKIKNLQNVYIDLLDNHKKDLENGATFEVVYNEEKETIKLELKTFQSGFQVSRDKTRLLNFSTFEDVIYDIVLTNIIVKQKHKKYLGIYKNGIETSLIKENISLKDLYDFLEQLEQESAFDWTSKQVLYTSTLKTILNIK